VGIAVAAMAAVYGLNWAVMRFYVDPNCQEPQDPVSNDTAVSNVTNAYHHNNMRGFCDPDPADLSYPERMGILAFLTGAGIVVQKAALHAPSAVRAVRSVCSWVGSLWQRSPSNPAPDVEQGVQPRVVAL